MHKKQMHISCTETIYVWTVFDIHSATQKKPRTGDPTTTETPYETTRGPSNSLEFVHLRSNYPGSCAQIRSPWINPLSPGLPIFPSYVISLKGLWWATHFSVCTADPNKRNPPDEMLLCVCFCLVLEDHIASEDSVALGNNICLVSVGHVPSEQKYHLTRREGFESMSAQCGELHHSNESLQRAYSVGLFLSLLADSPNRGVANSTVLLILLLSDHWSGCFSSNYIHTHTHRKSEKLTWLLVFVCSNNFL